MKGTLSYASARFAERLVSFFLLPILTKIVTPTEYAIWSQSIIIASVLMPVILLKFETSIVKFFPNWTNQNKKQNSVILFMLTLILILFCLVATIALVFDEKIAHLIFGDYQLSLYIPLVIGLLLSELLFEFLIALLRISNRIRKISIYILMKGIWRLGTITLVLIGIDGGFYFAFWSFVLLQLFITLLLYVWEINPLTLVKAGFKEGRPNWAKVLKFSLPLVPFIILMMIHNFVDRFFIAHFLGLNSLAPYTAAFSIAVVITFFHSTISFMLYPELSKKWVNKNKTNIINLMKKVVTAYLALTIPFLVFIGIAGVDVLLALTTNDYLISTQTLFLISLNIAIFGLFQFSHYIVLLERGSLNAPILMTVVTGINILLNVLLIPKIGILGAAISGFFSNSILTIIVYNMSQKILHWGFPFTESVKILLRSLITGVVIWQGIAWFGNDTIPLVVTLIITGLIYIILDFFGKDDSSFLYITKLDKFIFRKFKRFFDFLIGDKSDEIYWRYKHIFNSDWRNNYLDPITEIHPHRELLINKVTHLNLIDSVLEVGCADGVNLRIINKKIPGIKLEGFDINKKALSDGVNILKRENISNITLKHQSAKNLGSYDTGQFDVVFCDAVLMYLGPNNINQALKEMVRISKKSVIICEQHNNGNSFYEDKWVHNYDILLKNISGIQSVVFHSISDDIWSGDWSKYGKIIVVEKT